jgi:hypothetical protein
MLRLIDQVIKITVFELSALFDSIVIKLCQDPCLGYGSDEFEHGLS